MRVVEGACGGDATLLHGDGSERREADHIADGVNVFDIGLIVFVDRYAAAIVSLDSGGGEIQVFDGALAAYCIEKSVAGDAFLAFKVGDDGAIREFFDA